MSTNLAAPRSDTLCKIIFDDGKRCHMSKAPGEPHHCYFHARRRAQNDAEQEAIDKITAALDRKIISLDDLASAIAHTIRGVAEGYIEPKTAATIAYLCQSLVQTVTAAENLRYRQSLGLPNP